MGKFRQLLQRFFSGETFDYRAVFGLLGPVVVDQFFLVSFNFLNTAMIASSGAAAISAVNMVGSVNVFLIQIFVAVGLGIGAFVLGDSLLLALFKPGIRLFSPTPAILPVIFLSYCIFVGMHLLFWTVSFVLPNALRAAGDGKFTTIVSLASMWAFRVVGVYVFAVRMGYGVPGVCAIMGLEWGVRGGIFIRRFAGDKWYQNKLI